MNFCLRMPGQNISTPTSYMSMLTLYLALPCWAIHRSSRAWHLCGRHTTFISPSMNACSDFGLSTASSPS